MARLRICAGSSEPSLLADAISTKSLCAGSYTLYLKEAAMIDYILLTWAILYVPLTLYSGGFFHTDKCNKDGIVHYLF